MKKITIKTINKYLSVFTQDKLDEVLFNAQNIHKRSRETYLIKK